MIQDIEEKFKNEFDLVDAQNEDQIFLFDSNRFLTINENGRYRLPAFDEVKPAKCTYLFAIGTRRFFLGDMAPVDVSDGYEYTDIREIRTKADKELSFASATAYHLYRWYSDNKYCGHCGELLIHDKRERMLKCPACGNMVYPKISPAVIVAVTDGDRILFTKYAGRAYKKYALIAGFTEIGETAEQTVEREVLEEVGLKVKNIRYYKSQPWGTDCNLLMGFFADLDGPDRIILDQDELSTAEWINRENITAEDDGISLTREMMRVFKEGKER